MSDNVRTALRFTAVKEPVEAIASGLADYFDSTGVSTLIGAPSEPLEQRALFRPFDDTPQKYIQPEWRDAGIEPVDRSSLAMAARQFESFAIHTSFSFGGRAFGGSVYVYETGNVNRSPQQSQRFVKLSFHSALTEALRGTREFGVGVTIDREVKSDLFGMVLGIAGIIHAEGFVYGLEQSPSGPVTSSELSTFLVQPDRANALFGQYAIGIRSSIVSRDMLVGIWGEEFITQSTTGFVILDLLQDSESLVEDEEDEFEEGE
jgi:hypothetical protein